MRRSVAPTNIEVLSRYLRRMRGGLKITSEPAAEPPEPVCVGNQSGSGLGGLMTYALKKVSIDVSGDADRAVTEPLGAIPFCYTWDFPVGLSRARSMVGNTLW